jgi:aerobic C4-dicarboxylate transport protein
MKIWIKLLIGIILGIILGYVIPANLVGSFFDSAAQIAVNIGRYVIFPLVFFSLIFGTYELKLEKARFKTYGFMFLFMIVSTLVLVLIGVLSVFIFFPKGIAMVPEEMEKINVPGLKETLLTMFPKNVFNTLIDRGDFLLPLVVLALVIGTNLTFDKIITRPVVQLVDSLSRIFYHINSFVAEIFAVGLLAITTSTIMKFIMIEDISIYFQLIIILIIDMAIVLFCIFPLLLYFFVERKNPFKWLYAITAPLLTAFATGDEYISLGMLIKHGRENMGIPRKIGSISYPMFALFGKAGTALVTSVSFIVILNSSRSLDISILEVLWVIAFSFLVSFVISPVPGIGAFTAISLLCNQFGSGVQEMYLILKPIAPLLVSFGVVMDVATSAFVAFFITHHESMKIKIEAGDFI